MTTAGLDEAGRGPVIGPMVVAGVLIKGSKLKFLKEIGVKDSKLLSRDMREKLRGVIEEIADSYVVKVVQPRRIDEAVSRNMLNQLEAEVMAEIIRELRPTLAIVDSPLVNTRKFSSMIKSMTTGIRYRLIARNKADRKYVHVAAASIIAKVERDRIIDEIKEELGVDFGSGYPSDPKTKKFIEELIKGRKRPSFVRWNWNTVRKHMIRPESLEGYL